MSNVAVTQFRQGIEQRDLERMLDALTPDAVLHSPAAGGLRFEGRAELADLFHATHQTYRDTTILDQVDDGYHHVIRLDARIGGQPFTETLFLRTAEDGRIVELTPSIRPLAGLAAVALAVGRPLARRHGPLQALAFVALIGPLAVSTRIGERLGARLVGGRRGSSPDPA